MGEFSFLDIDANGRLAKSEVRGPLETYFDRIDADANGALDREELSRAAERMIRRRKSR